MNEADFRHRFQAWLHEYFHQKIDNAGSEEELEWILDTNADIQKFILDNLITK